MMRFFAGLALLIPTLAAAQGNLVLYCAPQEEWCRAMVTAFERKTGIKVAMTRKSSGEIYAQVKAESSNPRGDIWWGGTGDPHLQAAEEGLLVEYKSPMMKDLAPWAVKQAEQAKYQTVGVYAGVLGFGYNTELLEAQEPARAEVLERPRLRQVPRRGAGGGPEFLGHVVHACSPRWCSCYGEDKGFDFLKRMHKNINQYTKSGAAPAKAAASGETLIGITFLHDLVTMAVGGAPLKLVAPCEGTGYEVGSMSIIKGGKNPKEARAWYDWALTPEAQALGARGQGLPDPVEQERQDPAAGAAPGPDQGHRLRLREVRLVGRAQAPAVEMG